MKLHRILGSIAFVCLVVVAARAERFEGTLKWTLNAQITDADLKAKMAETQKQMADPAKLAQMKAVLENPQMKAMMEQNPQMRAAMEAQIKMAEDAAAGKGGDMISAMMPKSMTLRTKAGKTHLSSEGGAMPMEVITLVDPPVSYWIDRKGRTYSKLPVDTANADSGKFHYTVKKAGGSAKILGYSCDEYVVEITSEGKVIHNRLWATNAIPGLDAKTFANTSLGGQEANYMKEIDGVPLKMEMTLPQMRITMQAVAVTSGSVPDSHFVVPEGFAEKPFTGPGMAK